LNNVTDIFKNLLLKYTRDGKLADALTEEIASCYSSSGRYYHSIDHVGYMLDRISEYKGGIRDRDTLLFAVFYHDIVYVPYRSDNEEKSAGIAVQRLKLINFPQKKIQACRTHILTTKTHSGSPGKDTELLCDADLAILGDSREKYLEYADNIRREYSVYPDEEYRKKREHVLRGFLDMKRIYKTDHFYTLREIKARQNIEYELGF
jgi:predicted metal-dependent HD superfamily phosphohydrolase